MQNRGVISLPNTTLTRESLPALRLVGLLTCGLVWFAGASSLPDSLPWLDERLIIHTSAILFIGLSVLLSEQSGTVAKVVNLLAQAVCAAAFIAVDVSSSGPILNIVLVAQIPFVLGIGFAAVAAVLINLVHVGVSLIFHGDSLLGAFLSVALLACFHLFALLVAHFAIQASEARAALSAANAELLATRSLLESSARDRERLRVSRELHDTAGHTLTALKLNLRTLRDGSEGETRDALQESLTLASDLLEDIRRLVGNLREHDALDLQEALSALTQPFSSPQFSISIAEDARVHDLSVAENLLAVARESITNVVRHSRATSCRISVYREEGRVCLTVSDDGIGADAGSEGFGIRGMRERVVASDGELDITSNNPSGTRVAAAWACP